MTVARASVVIPAHNEARTIGRNLAALRAGARELDLDVVVVCNGCTDGTAEAARAADPAARVIEIPQPSKTEAVRVGNAATSVFPRVHLDADVELSGTDLRVLLEPLARGEALATAPRRRLPRDGCSRWVEWYYDVWEELPQVRAGLFGRGVVAVAADAQARIERLPTLMSDDLAISEVLDREERRVVEGATVVVHPPRTLRDLVRRRIRVATGNVQAGRAGVRRAESVTRPATLLAMVGRRPSLAPRLPVFLAVTVVARLGARRAVRAGDFTTWQRDESSRR
ncbi:glycosyltransferase [Nocardioides solisilvae]|uniref:glycosyltransferase n=1 Tax=Nocardioides solisilvae TaxID=1542435 RepID=UPI001952207B|nr:glycosyltransferase [Nocardioides solisilvae]